MEIEFNCEGFLSVFFDDPSLIFSNAGKRNPEFFKI